MHIYILTYTEINGRGSRGIVLITLLKHSSSVLLSCQHNFKFRGTFSDSTQLYQDLLHSPSPVLVICFIPRKFS